MKSRPRFIVFASGGKVGGGSGFRELVIASRHGFLRADIVAVFSNHENGGVREIADMLGIPFVYFPGPWTAEAYQVITKDVSFDYVALSGWLKMVYGLDPKITFNIHPGPLPGRFGGKGMYGHHVHEAVLAAYRAGEITHSAVSMHFIADPAQFSVGEDAFDKGGPVFFRVPVDILDTDDAKTLGKRVNAMEHRLQATITDLVVRGEISWDGKDPASLRVPRNYQFLPK
jgi:folate-dependent phosphoribosylglycinamide formyltransferase PurN